MTALVKLLLLVVSFSFLVIQTKCQNSEKVIQTNLGGFFFLLAQNNHVPQNQTFGFKFLLSDKVSEFKQTVRQVPSWIQTIALPALYWSFGFGFRGPSNSKIWLHTTRTAPSRMHLRLSSKGVHDPCGSARNKLLRSSYARSKCHFVATSFSLVHTRSFLTPPANPMEFDFKFGDRQIKFIIKRGALSPTGACRLPWSYEIGFWGPQIEGPQIRKSGYILHVRL